MMQIRALCSDDYEAWLPLWEGNNGGAPDPAITAQSWTRISTPDEAQMGGLAAWDDQQMAGLVHYILHPVTGHLRPACYMQDVYVAPDFRQRGIARQMITALAEQGRAQKWARIYWLAERHNEAAQALYRNIGVKLDFTLHVLPT